MTGSAGRADRFSTVSFFFVREVQEGKRARSRSDGRLADDGKRWSRGPFLYSFFSFSLKGGCRGGNARHRGPSGGLADLC